MSSPDRREEAEIVPGTGPSAIARLRVALGTYLSRAQMIVSLATGIVSIVGAVTSMSYLLKPAPTAGEFVAVVSEMTSGKAVADATIEVLTADQAPVTTMSLDATGRARHTLQQGPYRVRVSHRKFIGETRTVQVMAGQTTEVRIQLRPAASRAPLKRAERSVKDGVDTVRRFLGL